MTFETPLLLSFTILAVHYKWGRHWVALLAFAWCTAALPIGLAAWLVLPVTGRPAWAFALTWVIGIFFLTALEKLGLTKRRLNAGDQMVRGTQIINDTEVVRWLKRSGELGCCYAKIGKVPIPQAAETTNFMKAGAPGGGKTLVIIQLLDSARQRNHRALVADLGGEFVGRYYRPDKDFILNPFDNRTEHWSPFAEMRQSYDAARIAASMIPEGTGESKEWNGYARVVLEGILERCWETGQATNQALVFYALGAGTEELAELCSGTPAAVYFVEGNERQLGSIRGILASYIKPLTYLRADAGAHSFSIRKWVESEGEGWLFVTFRKDQLDALRKMMAAQIDTAATSILSRSSELSRRLWFSLDEFAQLGEISQLEPMLSLGRKYGVCSILGMQGITQPAMVYGQRRAGAILAGCGTWTVFRQGDNESAEYMSKFLGDEEIRRLVQTESTNKDSMSTSSSEQIVRQRALMPGELQQMPSRTAIVNLAGPMPPAWTTIPLPPPRQDAATQAQAIDEVVNFRAMSIKRPKELPPVFKADVVSKCPSDDASGEISFQV